MARIYRLSDRIPIKIDSITITVSPLSFDQKTELQSIMMQARQDPMYAVKGARLAIKYAVKSVSGIEDMHGENYQPSFEETGILTDESVDDLMNLEENSKLIAVCAQLIAGVPRGITDPSTGEPMKGVKIELTPPKPKARK